MDPEKSFKFFRAIVGTIAGITMMGGALYGYCFYQLEFGAFVFACSGAYLIYYSLDL